MQRFALLMSSIMLNIIVLPALGQTFDDEPLESTGLMPTTKEQLRDLERSIQQAIDTAAPAMVAIGNRFGRDQSTSIALTGRRFASGVIISEAGLVLTQYHVSHSGAYDKAVGLHIYGQIGDKVEVVLADGKRVTGELLGGDKLADISLVKLVEPGPYPFLKLGARQRPHLGHWNIKLGHPNGLQPERGISARLGRTVYANDIDMVSSCSIDGGDSGGPLIDLNANIVAIVNDSLMPSSVMNVATQRAPLPMSFMTVSRIGELIEPIRTSIVRDTTFRVHSERKTQYETVTETLAPDRCGVDFGLQSAYIESVGAVRESVVEILNPDKSRAAYGTIVSRDGFIVTLASRAKNYLMCRMHDSSVISAQLVGHDDQLDLALLKIGIPTRPMQWSHDLDAKRGTFLLAPTKETQWGLGILCAPSHGNGAGFFFPPGQPDQLQPRTWPMVFEHDIPLTDDSLGGPVLNLRGQAAGISIAKAGLHGFLAVPSENVKSAIAKWQADIR